MKTSNPPREEQNVVPLPIRQRQAYPTQRQPKKAHTPTVMVDKSAFQFQPPINPAPALLNAFIIMKINELEVLEEAFGQTVASELTNLVGLRLMATLRPEDFLEKISANEFAILAANIESRSFVEKLMKRIERQCNGEYVCSNLKLHISLSAGIAIESENANDYEEQLRFARIALRRAMHHPTASHQFFSPDMLNELQCRTAIIFEMHQAIKQESFVLHYQPQYAVDRNEIIAVEALLRLQGHDGELVYPDQFIDLAEKTGLILPIGHWVIKEACRQFKVWRDMGCAPRYIAVNVSSKQLADHSLIDIVDTAVNEAGIEYGNLELEITEQSLIRKLQMAEAVLNKLSAKGVRIALDDFGTGYSSLSYLDQLPLDVIKIDRSFLFQWHFHNRSAGLLRSIVYIAQEFDLEVVAEGVENEVQRQFIESIGIHLGQGYAYSRPQNSAKMTQMLQNNKAKTHLAI